jgi:hypothetical protein
MGNNQARPVRPPATQLHRCVGTPISSHRVVVFCAHCDALPTDANLMSVVDPSAAITASSVGQADATIVPEVQTGQPRPGTIVLRCSECFEQFFEAGRAGEALYHEDVDQQQLRQQQQSQQQLQVDKPQQLLQSIEKSLAGTSFGDLLSSSSSSTTSASSVPDSEPPADTTNSSSQLTWETLHLPIDGFCHRCCKNTKVLHYCFRLIHHPTTRLQRECVRVCVCVRACVRALIALTNPCELFDTQGFAAGVSSECGNYATLVEECPVCWEFYPMFTDMTYVSRSILALYAWCVTVLPIDCLALLLHWQQLEYSSPVAIAFAISVGRTIAKPQSDSWTWLPTTLVVSILSNALAMGMLCCTRLDAVATLLLLLCASLRGCFVVAARTVLKIRTL